ncbi:MAG TPA: DUF2235 domain-containing protein [Thermoanaerobaculia bacterium]|nr:DUF2235 domain-containing protein [Thermoanaerobaculia bacterium]
MDISTNPGRRLILCLDGTWNSTANEQEREDDGIVLRPTNPLKICRAILPSADKQQITYYDIGVGSLAMYAGTANRILYRADKVLGGLWGAGFEGNVEDALHFLSLNYQPGDEVYIFGFSRGAATARAVTRFLEWSGGLLPKDQAYFFPFFFRKYVESHGDRQAFDELVAATTKPGRQLVFRPIEITYLGVFDTVASLGSRFAATGEQTSDPGRTFHTGAAPAACVRSARQALAIDEKRFDFRPEVWTDVREGQTLEQRWFAGVHSNVGGGLKTDGLANIALQWILEGATAGDRLKVDDKYLEYFKQVPTAEIYPSWSTAMKIAEAIRLRLGKGVRPIRGRNADLHPAVIERMHALSTYRPQNVLEFLAAQPDLSRYGTLPPDVEQKITRIRAKGVGTAALDRP